MLTEMIPIDCMLSGRIALTRKDNYTEERQVREIQFSRLHNFVA